MRIELWCCLNSSGSDGNYFKYGGSKEGVDLSSWSGIQLAVFLLNVANLWFTNDY